MSDEVFRPMRNKPNEPSVEGNDPLSEVRKVQQAVAKETGSEVPQAFSEHNMPFAVSGNVPPEFKAAMAQAQQQKRKPQPLPSDENYETFEAPPERPKKVVPVPDNKVNLRMTGSSSYEALIQKLDQQHQWEAFKFPSNGKFYDNIPDTIHIRPMTGEEEQILATPRWVRRGKAIDMIFRRCINETIPTEQLLSVDRTHLLIYLRGISYTPDYDVEIRCPACTVKFSTVIDLDVLNVITCPENFDKNCLEGELPTSRFKYSYRLATGADEQEISNYRERRVQQYGDQSDDDTLLYRTALLLEEIEGVTRKVELAQLLKRLPINDVAHLRNTINEPPFGVDTKVPMMCPSCNEEFSIDLPLETNFFFPRKKETRTQV